MPSAPTSSIIYVIGNGFDLYHGLATGFDDFKKYVASKEPDLKRKVEEHLCELAGNWSNLEEALAYFDVDALLDYAANFLVSYGADDWSDSNHHDYQYEINQVVEAVSRRLKEQFYNWLQEVEIPNPDGPAPRLLRLNQNGKFLNFNYTQTLQQLYGIKSSQVVHIHGAVTDALESVILGHGWGPEECPKLSEHSDPESVDVRVMEGNELVDRYFEDTFKPTEKLISQHQSFFASLTQVCHVFVWGHSLSSVDMPYFREIVKWTAHSKPIWHVSYYSESSKLLNQTAIVGLGVPASKVIHHKLDQYHAALKTNNKLQGTFDL